MTKQPATYGKAEITEIMQLFHDHMGLKPTPEYRQRQYCQHLIRIFQNKALEVVKYAISIQSDHYAPRITSPKDLYYKHTQVMDYYRRNEKQANNNVRRAG